MPWFRSWLHPMIQIFWLAVQSKWKERIWVWGNPLFTAVISVALHCLNFQESANFVQPQPAKEFATCWWPCSKTTCGSLVRARKQIYFHPLSSLKKSNSRAKKKSPRVEPHFFFQGLQPWSCTIKDYLGRPSPGCGTVIGPPFEDLTVSAQTFFTSWSLIKWLVNWLQLKNVNLIISLLVRTHSKTQKTKYTQIALGVLVEAAPTMLKIPTGVAQNVPLGMVDQLPTMYGWVCSASLHKGQFFASYIESIWSQVGEAVWTELRTKKLKMFCVKILASLL